MTNPSSIPSNVLHAQPSQAAETTVETATKMERAKTLAKKTFVRVGVPTLIVASAVFVASRKAKSQDSDTDDVNTAN